MTLEHGTRQEHIETLQRAKENEVSSIWSGDLRNDYLRENLAFAEEEGIIKASPYDYADAQESGFDIEWLEHPEV